MLGAMFSGRHNVKVDEKASCAESQADPRAYCVVLQSATTLLKGSMDTKQSVDPKICATSNSSYALRKSSCSLILLTFWLDS